MWLKHATLTITNGLQTEITSNTVAITGIQNELITMYKHWKDDSIIIFECMLIRILAQDCNFLTYFTTDYNITKNGYLY